MNPLRWKREHQIALLCAIVLGGIFGVAVGLRQVTPYGHSYWKLWCAPNGFGDTSCTYITPGYWLLVTAWAGLGGTIGAALVYIRQLLKS